MRLQNISKNRTWTNGKLNLKYTVKIVIIIIIKNHYQLKKC